MKRNAFTLLEMLIVVGIIAVLSAASIVAYDKVRASADRAKCAELLSQTETALTMLFELDRHWPKVIREASMGDGLMNEKVAGQLAGRNLMSLSHRGYVTTAADRFGIVTPWAHDVIKRLGTKATLDSTVFVSRTRPITVKDNIFHFAVDLDGDGVVNNVRVSDSDAINIRATVAIWCIGRSGGQEGKPWPYRQGLKKDDQYSWAVGQTRELKK